jgi:hypothetical protein
MRPLNAHGPRHRRAGLGGDQYERRPCPLRFRLCDGFSVATYTEIKSSTACLSNLRRLSGPRSGSVKTEEAQCSSIERLPANAHCGCGEQHGALLIG